MKTWQSILLGILLGVLITAAILVTMRLSTGTPVTLPPIATPAPILVQVDGAVLHPGLYALPSGSRVQDAVAAAGGVSKQSNTSSLNLAARLKDGVKVIVPFQAAVNPTSPPGITAPNPAPAAVPSFPIDLNTATLEQLDTLPGIGPSRAGDIIQYRDQHGGFQQIDELKEVRGIGDATFEALKDLVTINGIH